MTTEEAQEMSEDWGRDNDGNIRNDDVGNIVQAMNKLGLSKVSMKKKVVGLSRKKENYNYFINHVPVFYESTEFIISDIRSCFEFDMRHETFIEALEVMANQRKVGAE